MTVIVAVIIATIAPSKEREGAVTVYDLLWHLLALALRGKGRHTVMMSLTKTDEAEGVRADLLAYDWRNAAVCAAPHKGSTALIEVRPATRLRAAHDAVQDSGATTRAPSGATPETPLPRDSGRGFAEGAPELPGRAVSSPTVPAR